MNIHAKKLEIVRLILNTEKPAILNRVAKILIKEGADWREGLPEKVIESVEKGLQQARSGDTIPHEEVMEKYQKWL